MASRPSDHRALPRSRPRLRLGLAVRRRPALRWALTAAAALAVGLPVAALARSAEEARAAWGVTRTVAVATRDLDVGQVLRAGDTHLVALPERVLPEDPFPRDPTGRVVHSPVFEGEVLVGARLARPGLVGVAAALPEGTRAVAIPFEAGTTPPVEVGQRVDVIVALPPEQAGDGPPGIVVAVGAPVLAVSEAAVTLAVDADTAPRVAVALASGAVTLAIAGEG
jgi:Flp pilus assembly protein CpaB